MKLKNNLSILERELNEFYETHKTTVPAEAYFYIRRAMISFSVKAIHEDRAKRRKRMVDTLKHLPKMFRIGYYHLLRSRLKQWFFNMAVKQAHIEAQIQNRKIWIVQATDLTYKLISTRDFKHGKSIKVFKKELTFQDMDSVAALTVYPIRQIK